MRRTATCLALSTKANYATTSTTRRVKTKTTWLSERICRSQQDIRKFQARSLDLITGDKRCPIWECTGREDTSCISLFPATKFLKCQPKQSRTFDIWRMSYNGSHVGLEFSWSIASFTTRMWIYTQLLGCLLNCLLPAASSPSTNSARSISTALPALSTLPLSFARYCG